MCDVPLNIRREPYRWMNYSNLLFFVSFVGAKWWTRGGGVLDLLRRGSFPAALQRNEDGEMLINYPRTVH